MQQKRLTENERKTYEFIKKRITQGYPPTVREVCFHCGFRSTSTAHRIISSLTSKGYLEKGKNMNRALRLTGLTAVKIPVLNRFTPDKPLTAPENISGYIEVSLSGKHEGELFAVCADKDIPVHAVKTGDIVIFEKVSAAENGTLAAYAVRGKLTVENAAAELNSTVGKAVAVLREL